MTPAQSPCILFFKFAPQGEEPLFKRMATPAGARWITVHPGGNKDAKGTPVMVQETQHGSGVYHVIGGAGGKLNYLKMRGLKPETEYKEHAAERRKTKMLLDKQRRDRDKKSGMDASKASEKNAVKQQQHEAEKQFYPSLFSPFLPLKMPKKAPKTACSASIFCRKRKHIHDPKEVPRNAANNFSSAVSTRDPQRP